MGMTGKKITTEDFIKKARAKHGDKYDYSLTRYVKSSEKVTIICPEHGEFLQTPNNHLKCVYGCSKCAYKNILPPTNTAKKPLEHYLERANRVHNNYYTYPFTHINLTRDKVKIICPKHGPFYQIFSNHMNGFGCPKCKPKGKRITTDDIISQFKAAHGDRYDYSLVEYKGAHTTVKIICQEHGVFEQRPYDHAHGRLCRECWLDSRRKSK